MADYNSSYTGAQIDANLALAATAVQPADDAADLGSGAATDGYVLTADGSGGAAWEAAAGGGGTPGGTDTQVQFNDGGAFGGDSGFTFDKTNNTLGLGGGTITASDPIIDMAQTWNNAAVTFTAIKANVTDTASAAGSLLMDLQVGGVSRFSVGKGAGAIFATNLVEQRNGVNAQAFNLYNTYTDASNYERGFMKWSANQLQVGLENLGTGTARSLKITAGTRFADIALGVNYNQIDVTTGLAVFSGNVRADGTSGITALNGPVSSAGTGSRFELVEVTAPAAPATNAVRIFAEDNGSGKTRLMARFATGAAVQIAIEP